MVRCIAGCTLPGRFIDYERLPTLPFFAIDFFGGAFHSVRPVRFVRWSQVARHCLQVRLPQGTHPFFE